MGKQLVLEVKSGSEAGRRFALQPDRSITIGRGLQCGISFPSDSYLSNVHAIVRCGAEGCFIRDNNSATGITVNGHKVSFATLADGDEIVVGQTRLGICSDAAPGFASAEFQPLYAILDAAADSAILPLLERSKEEYASLYEGARGDELKHLAPHLVRLPADSSLLQTLLLKGRGRNWGIYLICDLPLAGLRKHLRHFLQVTLPDKRKVIFRFYDPRVLRAFLPTTNREEANEFFGPIRSFVLDDESVGAMLQFKLDADAVGGIQKTVVFQ